MRQNKFKKGDIINNLIILDKDKIVTTNNGSKKTYWICKCKICGSIKSKSTQTIENCKSCGCFFVVLTHFLFCGIIFLGKKIPRIITS